MVLILSETNARNNCVLCPCSFSDQQMHDSALSSFSDCHWTARYTYSVITLLKVEFHINLKISLTLCMCKRFCVASVLNSLLLNYQFLLCYYITNYLCIQCNFGH